ncbi:hypothetical protein GGI35DRAFT_438689 [Trichoderma velutinum]
MSCISQCTVFFSLVSLLFCLVFVLLVGVCSHAGLMCCQAQCLVVETVLLLLFMMSLFFCFCMYGQYACAAATLLLAKL